MLTIAELIRARFTYNNLPHHYGINTRMRETFFNAYKLPKHGEHASLLAHHISTNQLSDHSKTVSCHELSHV